MKQFLTLVGFVIASITTGCGQSHTVWLDDLDLTAMTQGNGVAMKNKSVDGKTLTIGGQTFERGVGTHSVSEIAIQLDGKAVSFTAQVGLDDEIIEHKTSAEFIVIGDGARLWSSGIVKAGDAPKLCSVSLDGVKRLELIVADGGDGPYYDHADWADAKIISKGKKSFPTLKFIATEPYILTPPEEPENHTHRRGQQKQDEPDELIRKLTWFIVDMHRKEQRADLYDAVGQRQILLHKVGDSDNKADLHRKQDDDQHDPQRRRNAPLALLLNLESLHRSLSPLLLAVPCF